MKNNELKEKVLRNVKENIAISNIENEVYKEKSNKKFIIYKTLSACAAVVLVGVVLVNGVVKNTSVGDMAIQGSNAIGNLESSIDNIQSNSSMKPSNAPIIGFDGIDATQSNKNDVNRGEIKDAEPSYGVDKEVTEDINKECGIKNIIKMILEIIFFYI